MQQTENKADHNAAFTNKVWATAGILSLVVIVLLLLKTLFGVLLLALAGVLMAIYFHGFAGLISRRLNLPYKMALAVSVLINIILLTGFFWLVGARLQMQASELSETLPQTLDHAKGWLGQSPAGSKVLGYLNQTGGSGKTFSAAKQFFSSSFGVLSDVYIILLLGLFFTASPAVYKKGIVKLLPSKAKDRGASLLDKIHQVLKGWIKGQLLGFIFITVLTGIGLWILQMPLILTLALVAGLLNFVPNFGPIIAMVPAFLLALPQGITTAFLVAGMYTAIQVVQSAVTQPLIQKKMVSMPAAFIVFGQVAMGLLGGFWGILLATPIMAILMTVVKKLYIEPQSEREHDKEKDM
ncbi:AI-2E family transporter [Pedobacter sp.]|uniref:AI-2E family transporter n=1 Tax=Pedobacter sp. TaxID=1411316 RepID=UPI003C5F1113